MRDPEGRCAYDLDMIRNIEVTNSDVSMSQDIRLQAAM